MRHILLPLSKGLITKSGLKPSFLSVNLYCEVRLGLLVCCGWLGRGPRICSTKSDRLMEFDSGGTQVEGLQYLGRSIVREWFLKCNCFFIVWVRREAVF